MNANEIKANLTAEQWEEYSEAQTLLPKAHSNGALALANSMEVSISSLEALAERNRLIKKHQWSNDDGFTCPECEKMRIDNDTGKAMPHTPDCAIAAALRGVGE